MDYIREISYIIFLNNLDLNKDIKFIYRTFNLRKCALKAPLNQLLKSNYINYNGYKNCEILNSTKSFISLTFYNKKHNRGSKNTKCNIRGVSYINIIKSIAFYIDSFKYKKLKKGSFIIVYLFY